MTVQFQIIREADGKTSISAFLAGQIQLAPSDHPNFREIFALLAADDVTEEQLLPLFNLPLMIGQKFEHLSTRVTVSANKVYFDGDPMNNPLTNQILRRMGEGGDYLPLVNFYEKVKANPETYSQEQLYSWLDVHDFTIEPDGDIIAYKGVDSEWMSVHSGRAIVNGVLIEGKIPNNIGNVIEMPREEVTFDPNSACSVGLHAATFDFASHWGGQGNRVVALKINPTDVVSVPADSAEKMRVCRYVVSEEVAGPFLAAVHYSEPLGEVDMTMADEDDEDGRYEYDEDDEDLDADDVSHKFGVQRDYPGMTGVPVTGTEGHDRDSYTDDQDSDSYTVDETEEDRSAHTFLTPDVREPAEKAISWVRGLFRKD